MTPYCICIYETRPFTASAFMLEKIAAHFNHNHNKNELFNGRLTRTTRNQGRPIFQKHVDRISRFGASTLTSPPYRAPGN